MTEQHDDRHVVTTTLEFPYRRSLGPVIGGFARALAEERIVGVRTQAGDVLVPPTEHDPRTGESVRDGFVDVGPAGEVQSWTWVSEPTERHPIRRPFAFALIRLDGADTALVHAVDAEAIEVMRTGLRVVPMWRAERTGRITDIECFVPAGLEG